MSMNMSYCRFANTLYALRECYDAMNEKSNPFEGLSESEKKAANRLIALCREISDEYGIERS